MTGPIDLERIVDYTPKTVDDQPLDAAVLVPMIERGGRDDQHLLFTKRASTLGTHPGQMSFPGGRRERQDDTIVETALREAYEEIGLRSEEVDLVGRLDDIRTVTEFAVTPIVATVPDRQYDPDEHEVAEIVTLALEELLDPANYEFERREHPHHGEIDVHYFHVDGYTVWGATGRMLVQFLELTTDWEVPDSPGRRI